MSVKSIGRCATALEMIRSSGWGRRIFGSERFFSRRDWLISAASLALGADAEGNILTATIQTRLDEGFQDFCPVNGGFELGKLTGSDSLPTLSGRSPNWEAIQQLLDLCKRKAHLTGSLDHSNTLDNIFVILAPATLARRFWEQTFALIEPDG